MGPKLKIEKMKNKYCKKLNQKVYTVVSFYAIFIFLSQEQWRS